MNENCKLRTMEELFQLANVNWEDMQENTSIDISNKNIKINSYNEKIYKNELKKILTLVRKEDSYIYYIRNSKTKDILLKATPYHRIYNIETKSFSHLQELFDKTFQVLNNLGESILCYVEKTEIVSPILDLSVEDNENYFTNGILSHNTRPGGEALKFYASQRLEIRKVETKEEGEESVANVIRVKVVKNKLASPFKKREFTLRFGEGIDKIADLVSLAVDKEIIRKGGAWYSYGEAGEKIGQGLDNTVKYLKEHTDIYEEIKTKLYTILFPPTIIEEDTKPVKKAKIKEEGLTLETISEA